MCMSTQSTHINSILTYRYAFSSTTARFCYNESDVFFLFIFSLLANISYVWSYLGALSEQDMRVFRTIDS